MKNKSVVLKNNDLHVQIILLLMTITGLALMLFKCLHAQAWQDEIYTLNIISYSYKDMLKAIAGDVHPPLYYLLLKIVMDFAKSVYHNLDVVLFARIISMVPFILLMFINGTIIKRLFGSKVALLFGFLITYMPKFMLFNITVRMYSLGGGASFYLISCFIK